MPKYKLTYFSVRARGEIIRLVFAAAKKEYEYNEITFAQWPEVKPTTPQAALPMIEIDGVAHGQSMAIAVFLASEFGLMGKTNMDNFKIEQLLHLREDMIVVEARHFLERDPKEKAEKKKKLVEETYPKFLALFDKCLATYGGTNFVVGDKLSLGDLVLYGALTTAIYNAREVVEKFPKLMEHRMKIAEIDGIKQYLASLPSDSPM